MRILAVDDDEIHLSLLELLIKQGDAHQVCLANSAEDAMQQIHNSDMPFECFLLDIEMPGMNGIELCAEIRKLPSSVGIPILMLTRISDQDHMEAAFSAGATDYVTKPINKFEFNSRLRLANEFLMQKQRIDAMDAEVQMARSGLGTPSRIDLSTAITLQDVPGAIGYVAFENFLLRSSMETRNLDVLAIKVGNVEEVFHRANRSEFSFIVHCVADEISEALKRREYFLTYAGNGIFAIVLRDSLGFQLESFVDDLFGAAPDLEFKLADGSSVQPRLQIGSQVKAPFFARRANLRALATAIANAEDAAAKSEALHGLALSSSTRRRFGSLGWRKH